MQERYTPGNAEAQVQLPPSVATAPPPGAPSAHMAGAWSPAQTLSNIQADPEAQAILRGVTLPRADVMEGVWTPANPPAAAAPATEGATTPAGAAGDGAARPLVIQWEVPIDSADGFAEAEVKRCGPKRTLDRTFRIARAGDGFTVGAFTTGGDARGALHAPLNVLDEDGARTWASAQIQSGWAGE